MEIFIRLPNGKIITIDVHMDLTVEKLKDKIYEKSKIEPSEQELIYNGVKLEDSITLSEANIKKEATIYLIQSKPVESVIIDDSIQIKAQIGQPGTTGGSSVIVKIKRTDTVKMLLDAIREREPISKTGVYLMY